ncbi:MAG: DUF4363 family protein [Acutalibacteraceae bacterium]
MKRVLAAVALLAVVCMLSGGALWLQSVSTDRLLTACDEAMAAWESGDKAACTEQAQKLVELFENEMRWFPFFLHHSHVESLQQQVHALPLLIGSDDESAFPAELMRIRTQVRLLMEDEWVTPENIL